MREFELFELLVKSLENWVFIDNYSIFRGQTYYNIELLCTGIKTNHTTLHQAFYKSPYTKYFDIHFRVTESFVKVCLNMKEEKLNKIQSTWLNNTKLVS